MSHPKTVTTRPAAVTASILHTKMTIPAKTLNKRLVPCQAPAVGVRQGRVMVAGVAVGVKKATAAISAPPVTTAAAALRRGEGRRSGAGGGAEWQYGQVHLVLDASCVTIARASRSVL